MIKIEVKVPAKANVRIGPIYAKNWDVFNSNPEFRMMGGRSKLKKKDESNEINLLSWVASVVNRRMRAAKAPKTMAIRLSCR